MPIASIASTAFVMACAVSAGMQGPSYAWWLTATFTPRHDTIEGIPVTALNRRWVRASLLKMSDLPPAEHQPGEGLREHGFELDLQADTDADGVPERAVVGVFETASGEKGRFVLILRRGPEGWRKRAVFTLTGTPGFSAVAVGKNKRLLWVTCLECDSTCEVIHRRGGFRLHCASCCE
jgi:hypothetical protein